jgi:regulator of nucleoside diphosphate kinase
MTDKPKTVISSLDADRLEKLLEKLPAHSSPVRAELENELARADIVSPQDIPPTVVTMNSTVRLRVTSKAKAFLLTLVYPNDPAAGAGEGTISVTAPAGSALLGLSQGDEIDWPMPGGGQLHARIEEVTYQPERAGEYHR